MFNFVIFSTTIFCVIGTVISEAMIGPGKWKLYNIEMVHGNLDKFEFDITQRKYNRTHDMFKGTLTFHEDLGDFFGARVDICKYVDGGCKQYQVLTEDRFASMTDKFAGNNVHNMLAKAGYENPEFPLKMGKYTFDEYPWSWDGLPEEGPWGRYIAESCVMEATLKVGCVSTEVAFEKLEEDDDEEEEE